MKRTTRTVLAKETVEIVKRGHYELRNGKEISIAKPVRDCLRATRFFSPEALAETRRQVLSQSGHEAPAKIEVRNETTLEGIFRLHAETGGPVGALNFASAKHPGGGFLNGSQAQEESLARSSALHASLLKGPEYYERHRAMRSCLYSHAMILSPGCPIFRDDDGNLLAEAVLATFITSAAPNAGAIGGNAPEELSLIPEALRQRAELVLGLAVAHGCANLVLGAWGCGVFRNDPTLVAQTFASHLVLGGPWRNRFRRLTFSIRGKSDEENTYEVFRKVLEA